ncbi:NAD(P)-dependent oxidoreductase [Bdellovibrionota bacterium FG-2]
MPQNDLSQSFAASLDLVGVCERLKSARIFITGGTGFFGCWFLEAIHWLNTEKNLGIETSILTRDAKAFLDKWPHLKNRINGVHFVSGEVRTLPDLRGQQFSHVIHAATPASAKLVNDNPMEMFDIITSGTRNVLEFAHHAKAQRFLLTSSGAVYGRQPPEISHLEETFSGAPNPCDPKSAYGEGKRVAEHLCAAYSKGTTLEPVIARCFAFIGPYLPLDIHFAIGNFIRDAMAGTPIRIQGDGSPLRSYLYGSDLMVWLFTLLAKGEKCRPYNVGSEQAQSIAEIAHTVSRVLSPVLGHAIEVEVAKVPTLGVPPERYIPSTKRAQTELGLKETVKLEQAIERTARWYLETSTRNK